MSNYKDLLVWQMSIELVKDIYRLIPKLPDSERYNLSDQMKRSAVSVPSNIAECAGRGSNKDYLRFLYIARGSLRELETQLIIIGELEFYKPVALLEKVNTLSKMLAGLVNAIKYAA
ncbi:four helix bundle protein [Endozoicomonas atrinae]|uniref:four helix bundle protein n=1 Tax=Endozoicomonas atrinae TaxID=1333660 RepID=UPI003AFF798A